MTGQGERDYSDDAAWRSMTYTERVTAVQEAARRADDETSERQAREAVDLDSQRRIAEQRRHDREAGQAVLGGGGSLSMYERNPPPGFDLDLEAGQ